MTFLGIAIFIDLKREPSKTLDLTGNPLSLEEVLEMEDAQEGNNEIALEFVDPVLNQINEQNLILDSSKRDPRVPEDRLYWFMIMKMEGQIANLVPLEGSLGMNQEKANCIKFPVDQKWISKVHFP